ncbi:MAG: 5'/3'-nucleotidase SurE [Pseudomonadota bacterium]|nr:5'/3'-nucleotidase SurE [Pseudomonadota bacterium]
MFRAPLNLRNSRILVSNDDGIDSVGIKKLEAIAKKLTKDVWVVAPKTEQSAASHSLTLRSPLRINKVGKNRFCVNGTPADCVLLSINKILKDAPPNLVLSGINYGSNICEDMTYSGTIAAAMEATLSGIPAIAFSQEVVGSKFNKNIDWSTAEDNSAKIIKKLVSITWPKDVLINVNFPPVPKTRVGGIEITREGRRKIGDEIVESYDPRGEPYFWIGAQKNSVGHSFGTDLAAINNNRISITPLSINLTHQVMKRKLRDVFEQ